MLLMWLLSESDEIDLDSDDERVSIDAPRDDDVDFVLYEAEAVEGDWKAVAADIELDIWLQGRPSSN